jgi:hypothetical protein
VQIGDLPDFLFELEKPVKQGDSKEKGLIVTLKICENLDHPIDHSCPQTCGHFVPRQALMSVEGRLDLQIPLVFVDVCTIVHVHMKHLSLYLS